MSLNSTVGKSGNLYNGIVNCGSDLFYFKVTSMGNKSHTVSWGSYAHDEEFKFVVPGSALQSKAHHTCVNNRLLEVLSSEVDDETTKYQVSRYSAQDSIVESESVLMNGSLAFVRFDNSFSNDIIYSRRNDQYLFRILTESGTIKGPLAEDFSGRIMVMKSLYAKYLIL